MFIHEVTPKLCVMSEAEMPDYSSRGDRTHDNGESWVKKLSNAMKKFTNSGRWGEIESCNEHQIYGYPRSFYYPYHLVHSWTSNRPVRSRTEPVDTEKCDLCKADSRKRAATASKKDEDAKLVETRSVHGSSTEETSSGKEGVSTVNFAATAGSVKNFAESTDLAREKRITLLSTLILGDRDSGTTPRLSDDDRNIQLSCMLELFQDVLSEVALFLDVVEDAVGHSKEVEEEMDFLESLRLMTIDAPSSSEGSAMILRKVASGICTLYTTIFKKYHSLIESLGLEQNLHVCCERVLSLMERQTLISLTEEDEKNLAYLRSRSMSISSPLHDELAENLDIG